ncbi:translation initiation factor 2 [Streptomyces sp. NPDC059080]|uniref:translation initiation factor 2 n=1 Tax=Streptomyces sp. NPDC059080 TaxID=3346718 RepID=UPI0036CF8D73
MPPSPPEPVRHGDGDAPRAAGRALPTGRRTADTARTVLFAARSAVALHRLLDTLPVFAGDHRITRVFSLVPGSDFSTDALAALEAAGARTVPWSQALGTTYDLTLAASPKGDLHRLRGPLALLPHGAGFNKSLPADGPARGASGLDTAYLVRGGAPLAALHALAHPGQIERLAARSPEAAARAAVVGDPTLDRLLSSRGLRDRYRAALGAGGRRLIALTSTWGPRSLLARHPGLPARLTRELPLDEYRLALLVHPNAHSSAGRHELAERLAPALAAGLTMAAPYEEWASVLVAADAVLCDHGSTALYAAALGRPLLSVGDGGDELIPGTPMDRLLAAVPVFEKPGDIADAIRGHHAERVTGPAAAAFAEQGNALPRLRARLYACLGLTPPTTPLAPRLLPVPRAAAPLPAACAVRTRVHGTAVSVARHPAADDPEDHPGDGGPDAPAGHLAVEEDAVGVHLAQGAALLFRRALGGPGDAAWTAAGWIDDALAAYPGRRTVATVLTPSLSVLRRRGGALLAARTEPYDEAGRVVRPDQAAVLSALHAWLTATPDAAVPAALACTVGDRTYRVRLEEATEELARREL